MKYASYEIVSPTYVLIHMSDGSSFGQSIPEDVDVENAAKQAAERLYPNCTIPDPAPPGPNDEIDKEIRRLEFVQLLPRATREGLFGLIVREYSLRNSLSLSESMANLLNPEHEDYNKGLHNLKLFDDEIKVLRAQRV